MHDLLEQTHVLLKAARSEKSLLKIAEECGPPVEYDWLKKFASKQIKNPAVTRVQHLHDRLNRRKQNVGGRESRVAPG